MYTFPDLLKKIRAGSNLTQQDLAQVLGVSTILVSMIESGQKEASKNFIARLAEKLDVQASSIIPFVFIENEHTKKQLSGIEKELIKLGEKLQNYLIQTKAKNLRRHANT